MMFSGLPFPKLLGEHREPLWQHHVLRLVGVGLGSPCGRCDCLHGPSLPAKIYLQATVTYDSK